MGHTAEYQAILSNIDAHIQKMCKARSLSESTPLTNRLYTFLKTEIPDFIHQMQNDPDVQIKRIAQSAMTILQLFDVLPGVAIKLWQCEMMQKERLELQSTGIEKWNLHQVTTFANALKTSQIKIFDLTYANLGQWDLKCFRVLTNALKDSQVTELSLGGGSIQSWDWPHLQELGHVFRNNVIKLSLCERQLISELQVLSIANALKNSEIREIHLSGEQWDVSKFGVLIQILQNSKVTTISSEILYGHFIYTSDAASQSRTLCLTSCHLSTWKDAELKQIVDLIKAARVTKLVLAKNKVNEIEILHFMELMESIQQTDVVELDLRDESLDYWNTRSINALADSLKKSKIQTLHLWPEKHRPLWSPYNERISALVHAILAMPHLKVTDFLKKDSSWRMEEPVIEYQLQFLNYHMQHFAANKNEPKELALERAQKLIDDVLTLYQFWLSKGKLTMLNFPIPSLELREMSAGQKKFSFKFKKVIRTFLTKLGAEYGEKVNDFYFKCFQLDSSKQRSIYSTISFAESSYFLIDDHDVPVLFTHEQQSCVDVQLQAALSIEEPKQLLDMETRIILLRRVLAEYHNYFALKDEMRERIKSIIAYYEDTFKKVTCFEAWYQTIEWFLAEHYLSKFVYESANCFDQHNRLLQQPSEHLARFDEVLAKVTRSPMPTNINQRVALIQKLVCSYLKLKPKTTDTNSTFFSSELTITQFKQMIEALESVPDRVRVLINGIAYLSGVRIEMRAQNASSILELALNII